MKLLKTARPLLTWKEPTLFAARTRDRRGWLRRAALALLIASVMMIGFAAEKNRGRQPNFSWAGAVLTSAFIGVFVTSLLDAPDLNREITISDDSISYFGNAGEYLSMSTWALRDGGSGNRDTA
jgi:hypothetical protein